MDGLNFRQKDFFGPKKRSPKAETLILLRVIDFMIISF